MGKPEMTRDELFHKLATLESKLWQAQKLSGTPHKKAGWWRQLLVTAVLVLVVVILLPGASHALSLEQEVLVGLKGVMVMVEDLNPAAERLGLSKDQIQTDVELRLRGAGIKVLREKEMFQIPGYPRLYVNVNTIISEVPVCAFSIRVELKEFITLANGLEATGAVWQVSSVGVGGINKISKIRSYVGDEVDKFINDYLAANPK